MLLLARAATWCAAVRQPFAAAEQAQRHGTAGRVAACCDAAGSRLCVGEGLAGCGARLRTHRRPPGERNDVPDTFDPTVAVVPGPPDHGGGAAVAQFAALRAAVLAQHPQAGPQLDRAFALAAQAHDGQFRRSGDPYITHPVAVAQILADYGLDVEVVVAALLHDVAEDTDVPLARIAEVAGDPVAQLVDGVTKLDRLQVPSKQAQQAATMRKLVVATAGDLRVLLVKLADRLHNVRTLAAMPAHKAQQKAQETLDVYAPLAARLGAEDIKHELEDRCFWVLHPDKAAELQRLIDTRAPDREQVLAAARATLAEGLAGAGIAAQVDGRPKRLYSIYRKMTTSGRSFDDIFDLIGLRVIADTVPDCYLALGVAHTLWAMLPSRFADYISTPKHNLYQSLHTTVIGPDGRALEIQLRTAAMHARAETGIAAHWRYKDGDGAVELPWLADLSAATAGALDPATFLADVKRELTGDEVLAVTPHGDIKALPAGSTPVDFAYAVHTEVGDRCIGATVNGELAALDVVLRSGDVVDITTAAGADRAPDPQWLQFATTARARAAIRQALRRTAEDPDRLAGQLTARLQDEGAQVERDELRQRLHVAAAQLEYPDLPTLQEAVDEQVQQVGDVLDLVRGPNHHPGGTGTTVTVSIDGIGPTLARPAVCCQPDEQEPMTGFVTGGYGVVVHQRGCPKVAEFDHRRVVSVSWAPRHAPTIIAELAVEALDRVGLLRDVTGVVAQVGGWIGTAAAAPHGDCVVRLTCEVKLSGDGQLVELDRQLSAVAGVFSVQIGARPDDGR